MTGDTQGVGEPVRRAADHDHRAAQQQSRGDDPAQPGCSSGELAALLCRSVVLPVVRGTQEIAGRRCRRLLRAGSPMVELTCTVPGWTDLAPGLVELARSTGAVLGLGTVTEVSQVRAAAQAGIGFVVTPWPVPGIREVAVEVGLGLLPGCFSPGEVAAAAPLGPLKLFPAHTLGPAYLRSLRDLLPGAGIVPAGGLGPGDVATWIDAGALAVGMGGALADRSDLADALARAREDASGVRETASRDRSERPGR